MGLYDGMDAAGTYSTAELAKMLKAPVLLVLDCTKVTRTAAALLLGMQKFDKKVDLRGVVLNQIAGARHEKIIREAIEKYCGIPVLGAIPKLKKDLLSERHMGLTPFQEHPEVKEALKAAGDCRNILTLKALEIAKSSAIYEGRRGRPENDKPVSWAQILLSGLDYQDSPLVYYPGTRSLKKGGQSL
jgi:cobyrinic acid a,c-diamide synthase